MPVDDHASPAPLLRLRQLRVGHPDQPALVRDWSADIPAGIALLHGDTGSGKSTVLRVLAGEMALERGTVELADAALPGALPAWRERVFFVDPMTEAFHDLSVSACVAQLCPAHTPDDAARWHALALTFGLEPHLHKSLRMLSTGSRRKVWLACALTSRRPLVLLDEPTAALDAASVRALQAALADAAEYTDRLVLVASSDDWPGMAWCHQASLPL